MICTYKELIPGLTHNNNNYCSHDYVYKILLLQEVHQLKVTITLRVLLCRYYCTLLAVSKIRSLLFRKNNVSQWFSDFDQALSDQYDTVPLCQQSQN